MFDLDQASEKGKSTGVSYQKPGIADNVRIKEVLLEKSSIKQSPYIRMVTEGPNGEVGSSAKMYLSDTKAAGKTMSSWSVTARNIIDIISATHNVDEAGAKATANLGSLTSHEGLRDRLASLLVGRPFRGKFKGEEGSKGTIFAILSQYESMRVESTRMSYDPTRDIKPFTGQTMSAGAAPVTAGDNDELPF